MRIRSRIVLIACAGIAAAALIAGCSAPVDPQQLLAEAQQANEKGDRKAAIIQLRNALQQNPGLTEARYLLGAIYTEMEDPASAEKEFRRAMELESNRTKILPSLAWSLVLQGKNQEALKETEGDRDSPEILSVRGYAELALGRRQDAARSFEKALSLDPRSVRALLGHARLVAAESGPDSAREVVDRVLGVAPRNVEALILGADLRTAQGNNDQAVAEYGQALLIQPDSLSAHIRRATALAALGKFELAQQDVDAARTLAPGNPLVTYAQAVLQFRWGKHEPALETIQQVLQVAPSHMPSIMLAAMLEYLLDSPAQAEKHIKQFIAWDPNNLFARKLLVSILLKSNQNERAIEASQPALRLAPQDAQLLALAGEAYVRTRQYAKAAEYLQQSASIESGNADVHARLGMTRLSLGDVNRAVGELETAMDLNRNVTQADTLLIMTYLRQQKFDKALEAALKLTKKQPENPIAYDLLGGAYVGKRDSVNARKSFEHALRLQADYLPAAMFLSHLDLRANDPDRARRRFSAALAKDEKNAGAMIGVASIDRATGNINSYVSWLEKAAAADPGAVAPWYLLARHYLLTKDIKKALAVGAEAKALFPAHPDILNLVAEIQTAAGDKTGALSTYVSLANAVPQSRLAHYRLALTHMANDDYAAATDSLKRALRLKPDYVDAKAAMALIGYRAGRYDESLKLAQEIQKHDAKSPVGYTLEGDSLMAQQKFAAAATAFEKAFTLRKSELLAIKLHAAMNQSGKTKEANARLLQWVREHPNDTAPRLYLADTYVKARQNRLAINEYLAVLERDPKNFLALNNVAMVLQQENDGRGLEYLERGYAVNPQSVATATSLGRLLVERGQVARGIGILKKAAAQKPDDPDIRYHLAAALAKSGQKADARYELVLLLGVKGDFRHRAQAEALLKAL